MKFNELLEMKYSIENWMRANFLAKLLNKLPFYDKKAGKIKFLHEKEINELINELIEKEDYINAQDLIDTSKNFSDRDISQKLSSIKSKSFRISNEEYINLVYTCLKNKKSISDIIRLAMIRDFKNIISKLVKNSEMNPIELKKIKATLKNWELKRAAAPRDSYSVTGYYSKSKEIGEAFLKFSEFQFKKRAHMIGLSNEVINFCITNAIKDYKEPIEWDLLDFNLKMKKNNLILEVNVYSKIFFDSKKIQLIYEDIKNEFGQEAIDKLLKLSKLELIDDFGIWDIFQSSPTFEIKFDIIDGAIYFEQIRMNPIFLDNLSSKIYSNLSKDLGSYELEEITQAQEQIKEALAIGDMKLVSQLNYLLATDKVLKTISQWLADTITGIVESSDVITITIPLNLLYLWDLFKEKADIFEAVRDYWS